MAGMADRLQIVNRVVSAIRSLDLVMHFSRGRHSIDT
jgi:hypothetical protein